MASNFDDVKAFNEKYGILYQGPPRPLPAEIAEYRIKFMREELQEYVEAWQNGDLEKQFDALLDLVYVAMGTAIFHGFPWQAGWDEVQRANMSKVRATSAQESKRGSKLDVIKPPGWCSPDLRRVLRLATTCWLANRDDQGAGEHVQE